MMDTLEQLLESVAVAVNDSPSVVFDGKELNFAGPYTRLTITEAIEKHTGLQVDSMDEEAIRAQCRAWGMTVDEKMGKGKLNLHLLLTTRWKCLRLLKSIERNLAWLKGLSCL